MSLLTPDHERSGKKLLAFPHHLVASPRDQAPPGAGYMGLLLFIVSVAILFLTALVGFVVVGSRVASTATGGPSLPSAVWLSTALIALCSVALEWAHRSVKSGRMRGMRVGLGSALTLGAGFLASQAIAWVQLYDVVALLGDATAAGRLVVAQFYFLTALHAAHVVGGIVPLAWVWRRAVSGAYSSSWHPGVRYCALYWHFLGGVWVVTLAVLALTA